MSVPPENERVNGPIQLEGNPDMALFKRDPIKKLNKAYQQKMEAAMHALRRGDVRNNALLVSEAEAIKAQIEATEAP